MVLASASTFSGSVVKPPSGDEGLPKMCCRRTSRFGHLCSQYSSDCGSSLHSEKLQNQVGGHTPRGSVCSLIVGGLAEQHLPCWRWRCSLPSRGNVRTPWLFGACWIGDRWRLCDVQFSTLSKDGKNCKLPIVIFESASATFCRNERLT